MSRFISPDAPFPARWEHELSVMENSRSSFADWRERRRELTPTQQELAERIRTAFDGVSCGDSLGYMSGFAEDDYCEKDIINAFMQREQRTYWPAITPDLPTAQSCRKLRYGAHSRVGLLAGEGAYLAGAAAAPAVVMERFFCATPVEETEREGLPLPDSAGHASPMSWLPSHT